LAKAHADLGQFDGAPRCIGEAMTMAETTGEAWREADFHRMALVQTRTQISRDRADATSTRVVAAVA
jgi:hypothetical protein